MVSSDGSIGPGILNHILIKDSRSSFLGCYYYANQVEMSLL